MSTTRRPHSRSLSRSPRRANSTSSKSTTFQLFYFFQNFQVSFKFRTGFSIPERYNIKIGNKCSTFSDFAISKQVFGDAGSAVDSQQDRMVSVISLIMKLIKFLSFFFKVFAQTNIHNTTHLQSSTSQDSPSRHQQNKQIDRSIGI